MEQKALVEAVNKFLSQILDEELKQALWEPNWDKADNYLDSMVEMPEGEIFHKNGAVDPTGDRPLFSFYVEGYGEKFNVYIRHYRLDLDAAGNTITKPGHSMKHSRPRAFTEAYILPEDITDTRYWLYAARCSWSDNFSRKEGRKRAVEGALEKFGITVNVEKNVNNRVKFLIVTGRGPKSGERREVTFTV